MDAGDTYHFLIACLAIAGVPPFAGFFSKEEILLAAYQSDKIVYGIGLFVAALTAFYMFRLYFSVFWKKEAADASHHGEGTWSMKLPLIVLAGCTVVVGFIHFGNYISSDGAPLPTHFDIRFSIAPVVSAVAGILLAAYLYKKKVIAPQNSQQHWEGCTVQHIRSFISMRYISLSRRK
jgi:NADH:ubiquinone oxidoreductase subunit 5 (chain L)/Multisubunit Na+/H+ antiporter, MnhA subunit